jgi:hypothetical protein
MDDRRAHFLTMLGDACVSAGLASIPVEVTLHDGTRLAGTPSAQLAKSGTPAISDTGYSGELLIDGVSAQLDDVVEFVIRTP